MQVSVEKVSHVERRLTITVPANKVEESYLYYINEWAKKANIKGFRPGKAPLSYIKQRFGQEARKEAIGTVMRDALQEALQEHKLSPISLPRVEPKIIKDNEPLEFIASFEILPELGEIKFNLDKIETLKVDIQDQDIDYVLQQLQKQYASWTPVERPACQNDRLVIDYHAVYEDKADHENAVKDLTLELGSKRMLPGFEDGLIGVSPGEERTLNLSFPENFAVAEKAGKPISFVVKTKKIFEAKIPNLDEEFVKKLDIKSGDVNELKSQIRTSIEKERDRLVSEKMKAQVFQKLLEQNPLEVPSSLIEREAKNIHDEVYPPHQHHEHSQHSGQELMAFNEIAKKRIALGLLLAEYAKQNNLTVDSNRVNERIAEIASVYENPQEIIALFATGERRNGIEMQVMEDQAVEKMIAEVPKVEKIMSYAEMKGNNI